MDRLTGPSPADRGTELVDATARLATMNLFLHGVERLDGNRAAIEVRDSSRQAPAAGPPSASLIRPWGSDAQ